MNDKTARWKAVGEFAKGWGGPHGQDQDHYNGAAEVSSFLTACTEAHSTT